LKKRVLVALFTLATMGCTTTYDFHNQRVVKSWLDKNRGVLVSVPQDAWYENTQYPNSGRMTANAIRTAFLQHTRRVDVTDTCHGDECLNGIDTDKYGYYVKSEILHWEERGTGWPGKSDRIEIQLAIYDALSKKEIASTKCTGRGKWATFGGHHPQDLLDAPTSYYVTSLYK